MYTYKIDTKGGDTGWIQYTLTVYKYDKVLVDVFPSLDYNKLIKYLVNNYPDAQLIKEVA